MKKLMDLTVGEKAWYFKLVFSRSHRCTKMIKPVEIIMDGWKVITETKTGKRLDYKSGSEKCYETKEEAIEEWNAKVYSEIDLLQAEYERTKKYLSGKLL